MSNFDFIPQRKRQQHLFIVEGKHEKKELLGLMLQCFPEMNIQDENIVIYESNIFNLNARLEKELQQVQRFMENTMIDHKPISEIYEETKREEAAKHRDDWIPSTYNER